MAPSRYTSIRLDDELWARVDEAAAAADQNRSEWLRDVIAAKFAERPAVDATLVDHLERFVLGFERASELLDVLRAYVAYLGRGSGTVYKTADELFEHLDSLSSVTATHPDGES